MSNSTKVIETIKDINKEMLLKTNDKENHIFELISAVFKDKSKKIEIIEKLRPFFTLKVVPPREIVKVFSSVEKISPEKIDLIEEFKYEEEQYDSNSEFETKSQSLGLSNFDLDLSLSIFGHKQSIGYGNKDEKKDINFIKKTKIHCIHSIVVSLFRLIIDFKDIKFTQHVYENLNEIKNANITERKKLIEKLVDKFGLYVPLELLIGGRINISFEANSEEEKKEFHSILQKKFKVEFGGEIFSVSGSAKVGYNKKKSEENFFESINKIENLSKKIKGGDYMYKDDLKNWIKSFNINNLTIIEYKTLIPIYIFIQDLESKITICLQKYDDIVLQEIYNLIEKDFKPHEKDLYEGSPTTCNSWKVGITEEIYKSFIIYKKKICKELIISKKNNISKKEEIICGEVPEGFIIVGWKIKTNSCSKPYDINCLWERPKDFSIIGNDCYKFKVSLSEKNLEFAENIDIDIEWNLEIFCIHSNYLVPSNNSYNYNEFDSKYDNHYFINCDCSTIINIGYNRDCLYKKENLIKWKNRLKEKKNKGKDISKILYKDCFKNNNLYQDLKEVEYYGKKGFLNSIKLVNNNNYSDIYGYIKAPDNSPYKNGIFKFHIKLSLDEKNNSLKYKSFIKTKIFHCNIDPETGVIYDNYFFHCEKQSLLEALFVIFQFFSLNNAYECSFMEARKLFIQYDSSFNEQCQKWVEDYALKDFPNNIEYLFENSEDNDENNKTNEIEILCSSGKFRKIYSDEFSIKEIFDTFGINEEHKWSFIVGNNVYLNKKEIKEDIIKDIKYLGKLIIIPKTLCG